MNIHSTDIEPIRPAPRPRRASLLWGAGVVLLAYSGAIAVTGGVDLTIGGLRIRSRTWQRPALIGLACVAVAAVADRRRSTVVLRRAASVSARVMDAAWLKVSPRAVAASAGIWTLAAGLVFSTYTAGGADSSGYLNQSRLFARGRVVDDLRLPERPPWAESLYQLAPLGFRPAPDRRHLSPSYPPGYPLLTVPLFLLNERAALLVVPICGAFAVWWTFALGRRLRAPGPGAAAALLVSVSPTFLYQLVQPMSDVPVTAAWVLALCLAASRTVSSAALAGLAAGAAIMIRPNLMPLAALICAACMVTDDSPGRWRRALGAALATVPGIAALGVIQSIRYGSPFASGYGPMRDLFALSNIGPNLDRFPRWMFETHTPLVALFLLAPLWIARPRTENRQAFLILWLFAVAVVLAYLPYVYFQTFEWTYTRFLLPALPIMWLLPFAPVAQALRRVRPAAALLVTAPVLICLVVFSLVVAKQRYVFDLRDGERKYLQTADYVRRELPANAMVVSMQHSGSLWFYSNRQILRWDYVEPGRLDETLGWSAAHGYAPFIVVDGEEFDRMKERFGPAAQQSLARATPLARFGDATVYKVDWPSAPPAAAATPSSTASR